MRDKLSLNRNIIEAPLYLFNSLSNKILVRILFVFNGCYVIIVIEWTFFYLAMCNCMRNTVPDNGTPKFILFLIMRLNFIIATSCNSLIV